MGGISDLINGLKNYGKKDKHKTQVHQLNSDPDLRSDSKNVDQNVNDFKNPRKRLDRSRSPSPSRSKRANHLPNSRALIGEDAIMRKVRYHPSFEDFTKHPEVNAVTLAREQYEDLQRGTGYYFKALMAQSDATAWEVLRNPVAYPHPIRGKSNSNSDYDNTSVRMGDLRPWKHFPKYHDIKKFILSIPELQRLFATFFILALLKIGR